MSNHDHDLISRRDSRRSFLKHLGAVSGVMGLGLYAGVTSRAVAQELCAPPGKPGGPQRWRRDCRPIRPRRPASTLTSAEITKLRAAYQAMRDLDTSDPNDPRGFQHQAQVHCWNCGGAGGQVHFTWQFFAWHRAYLYFHERILGKLIGDMDFRLPYWDWETTAHRKIPAAYQAVSSGTNALWNGTREMGTTDELPEEYVGELVMDGVFNANSFDEFGGTATSSGIPEGSPHGNVHVHVGGDMGFFESAAQDPVFFAHHSNVDKVWSDWNKRSSTNLNPTDSSFLNLTWNFYDENKIWRSLSAAQVLNHENQLRYTYGPSLFIERLPCLLDWVVVRGGFKRERPWTIAAEVRSQATSIVAKGGRVRMHLRALSVPLDRSAVYRIYTDPEAAKIDEGPNGRGYLGVFPVVLNSRPGKPLAKEPRHEERKVRDIILNLSKRSVDAAFGSDRPLLLTCVERGRKGKSPRSFAVDARDVHFSLADVEM